MRTAGPLVLPAASQATTRTRAAGPDHGMRTTPAFFTSRLSDAAVDDEREHRRLAHLDAKAAIRAARGHAGRSCPRRTAARTRSSPTALVASTTAWYSPSRTVPARRDPSQTRRCVPMSERAPPAAWRPSARLARSARARQPAQRARNSSVSRSFRPSPFGENATGASVTRPSVLSTRSGIIF